MDHLLTFADVKFVCIADQLRSTLAGKNLPLGVGDLRDVDAVFGKKLLRSGAGPSTTPMIRPIHMPLPGHSYLAFSRPAKVNAAVSCVEPAENRRSQAGIKVCRVRSRLKYRPPSGLT